MTRETKVGLLAGMALILLIGILVSDHLSVEPNSSASQMVEYAGEGQADAAAPVYVDQGAAEPTPAPREATNINRQQLPQREDPIPMADELPLQQEIREAPTDAMASNDQQPVEGQAVANAPAEQTTWTESLRQTPFLPAHRVDYQRKKYHNVKAGENLSEIARHQLGDSKLWPLIRDANPKKVSANGAVRAGVRLLIPQPQQEEDPPAAQTGSATPRRAHIVVKPGDTLSELASKHLGSSRKWQELLEANRDVLTAPEKLSPGMKLKLPATQAPRVEEPQAAADNTPTPPRRRDNSPIYFVQPGDTLSSIAREKMGDSGRWYELYRANQGRIDDPDVLVMGTELVIP